MKTVVDFMQQDNNSIFDQLQNYLQRSMRSDKKLKMNSTMAKNALYDVTLLRWISRLLDKQSAL